MQCSPNVQRTMGWAADGRVLVLVHTDRAPDDDEWKLFVDCVARPDLRYDHIRTLIYSERSGPTQRQRAYLEQKMEGVEVLPRCALLAESRLARGIGLAVSWWNPNIKVFRPDRIDGAIAHLGLSAEEGKRSIQLLQQIRSSLAKQRSTWAHVG